MMCWRNRSATDWPAWANLRWSIPVSSHPCRDLARYWNAFSFDLGPQEQKGLLTYYGYAAELGVIDTVPDLAIWRKSAV